MSTETQGQQRLGCIQISVPAVCAVLENPIDTTQMGETLFQKLLLPEGYTYVRCELDPFFNVFELVVTHPDLPFAGNTKEATCLLPSYQRHDDGTVELLKIQTVPRHVGWRHGDTLREQYGGQS